MENINHGYLALGLVATLFFALQVWWISMTLSNGRKERILLNSDQTEELKKRLEKIFSKTAEKD